MKLTDAQIEKILHTADSRARAIARRRTGGEFDTSVQQYIDAYPNRKVAYMAFTRAIISEFKKLQAKGTK
ncbi:MAG: hypothetical protein EBS05_10195 [Proteobacteria bacterium]|nr:hypothetical protein [Pseudomonadota bacterium]NDD40337.1 hypothetical protein [Verrucomicrobiota bacterium]NDE98296.1 hypothetical protein [Verrucomicrobiota bacterium]